MQHDFQIFCDGGARGNPGPAAAAFVVLKSGQVIYQESKTLGKATNNEAEYAGVILALEWLLKNPSSTSDTVAFVLDSELVANQLAGKFKVKKENLRNRFYAAKTLEKKISKNISYQSVSREKNKNADFLVNKALDENSE
jgi:ribonuclease HI